MELIDRYGVNKEKLHPYGRSGHIKYIGLAPLGLKLVEAHREGGLEASKPYYDEGLNKLVCDFGKQCLEIMTFLKTSYLTEYESMFFVTALNLDTNTIADYIAEFRLLGDLRVKGVIELVQNYCSPENFKNWKNETQQIFSLLGQSVFFEYDNNKNILIKRL
ncbi:hypothetical protein JP0160_05860 [Helicobacter pylori]